MQSSKPSKPVRPNQIPQCIFLTQCMLKPSSKAKKWGKKIFPPNWLCPRLNLAKFEALKACEAESKASMHFLDSVHAKTIVQSKKGGNFFFTKLAMTLVRIWPRAYPIW